MKKVRYKCTPYGRMPDIDGLALATKIRQQVELSATRIILLTSEDRPGDLSRARELGIGANLLKPRAQPKCHNADASFDKSAGQ